MEYTKYIVQDGDYEISVHNDFNVKNPEIDINKVEFFELMTKHGLAPFLHNPNGPALYQLKTGKKIYFINGKALTPKQIEKIEHNVSFNKDLNTMLKEENVK